MRGSRDDPRRVARSVRAAAASRRLGIAGVALVATLGAAPPVWGATARVETHTVPPEPKGFGGGGLFSTVVYEAAPGEANTVTLESQPGAIVLTDTGATIAPATGCAAESASRVRCSTPGFPSVRANAADGDDTFSPGEVSLSVDLGEGNDRVPDSRAPLNGDGGPGDDLLSCARSSGSCGLLGGEGADTLTGGKGSDTLLGGAGADTATGGGGDDTVRDGGDVADDDSFDGGPGEDRLSYAEDRSGVTVDLRTPASTALTGRLGEHDRASAFEHAQGGSGADVLRGDGGENVLEGGLGADRLVGGGGADTLDANETIGRDRFPNRLDGGAGKDSLLGGQGQDRLGGGSGADKLYGGGGGDALAGGAGRDLLEGNAGRDSFHGGSGPDIVDTGDGERDRLVQCGTGRDRLLPPDSADPPGRRCERVEALDGLVLTPLRVRGTIARFRVSCASGPSSRCRGRVSLVGRGRRVLGRGSYAMRRGRTHSMRVRLTPAAARALGLRGRLAVTVRGRTNEILRRFAFRLILRR